MEKLVSIVLPIYNGEKYMRESIESVLAQTWKNWELIIVDDCSSDATAQIAQEYARMDPRIRYFRNEENLRLPRNLNRGFSLAEGDYLTWTSDDNLYLPKAIETMVGKLEQTGADFVFASCRIIDGNGKEIEYIMVNEESPRFIPAHNVVGACFLYTRKVYEEVGDYDPDYTLVEDYDYWQRIAMSFKSVGIPEILYKYRLHEASLTGTKKNTVFYPTLERMLLKNRPGFGRFDYRQNYYYYKNLDRCRRAVGEKNNPYRLRCKWFSFWNLCLYRAPRKIKRMLSKVGDG